MAVVERRWKVNGVWTLREQRESLLRWRSRIEQETSEREQRAIEEARCDQHATERGAVILTAKATDDPEVTP